jgi:hypothetical protein
MDGAVHKQGAQALFYYNAQAASLAEIPERSPVLIFHDYWTRISPPGLLPGRRHLDPVDIPKIISWLVLVEVLRGEAGLDFRYRLIGTSNNRLVGKDATGQTVFQAFAPEAAEAIHRHYADTVLAGRPSFWKTDVPTRERRFAHCFRAVFPLAADGANVDMLAVLLVPTDTVVY